MDVTKFNDKLNKLDGNIYTFEEEVTLTNGVYETELAHDNVNLTTLNVYTGSKLTGDKVNTYTTSTPSLAPWKTVIKIFSNVSPLYISYETIGDTVEADDINNVQDAIVDTQESLNNEIDRAKGSEKVLTDNLNAETYRATNAEKVLENNLNAETLRAKASENTITNTINTNKPTWDDKYTKNEVDNKFNVLATNMDWKESVATFADIATTYPTPDDGWTVNTKDTDITYRYSGSAWIPISANSIPLATSSVDGKMSKQDKIDHDDMNSKKHTHGNKGILDVITQALLDTWNAAYTHISDTVKHITSTERTNWNNAFSHISDPVKHITGDERTAWNNAKSSIDGLEIGGRNYFINSKRNISYGDGLDYQAIEPSCPYGFYAVGDQDANNWLRINNVITNNGYWTVSWEMKGSQSSAVRLFVDICDINQTYFQTTADNSWKRYSLTVNVTNYGDGSVYNFVDFENFAWAYFYIRNIKVEKGNKATDWTPAPEDKAEANHVHDDRYYTETESDNKYATKNQISQAGYGDMLKSVYDTNNDGSVDNADKLDGKHASDFAQINANNIFQGEQKFTYSGTFCDPLQNVACAIKVTGKIASSEAIYSNGKQVITKGCTWNDLEGV